MPQGGSEIIIVAMGDSYHRLLMRMLLVEYIELHQCLLNIG